MLEHGVHIDMLLLPGHTDPVDVKKFHQVYGDFIQNGQLVVNVSKNANVFFSSWSNGFEIWMLKKAFLARIGLSESKMGSCWVLVAFCH